MPVRRSLTFGAALAAASLALALAGCGQAPEGNGGNPLT